jgi:hypothetical protein
MSPLELHATIPHEEDPLPTSLSRNELNSLARVGARARLAELEGERQSILRAFPDLSGGRRGRPSKATTAAPARRRRRGRQRTMSATQRRAVSVRMKKYWADRRKAKGKG